MSNEDAFLAAIREASDGVASRLICTDWLQERGDHRVEFPQALARNDQLADPIRVRECAQGDAGRRRTVSQLT
jgi:uncharacterized protein (TIGR02996 family)